MLIRILFPFAISGCLFGMQPQKPETPKSPELEVAAESFLQDLPPELKDHIISYVIPAPSMLEMLKRLAQVSAINSQFYALANRPGLLDTLTKNYVNNHKEAAYQEFWHILLDPGLKEAAKLKVLEALLKGGIDPNMNIKGQKGPGLNAGTLPLALAAAYGSPAIVKLLLQYKADVNAKGAYGNTALHALLYNLKERPLNKVIAILQELCQEPTLSWKIYNNAGQTALQLAMNSDLFENVDIDQILTTCKVAQAN